MGGELGQVWGEHLLTHPPLGFGLLVFGGQASHSVLVACPEAKNSVLLQGLNFRKPIKCAFCGWGPKPLDVDLSSMGGPPPFPLSTRGWICWGRGGGKGEWGQPCCTLCPRREFISTKGLAKLLLLLPQPPCPPLLLPQPQLIKILR